MIELALALSLCSTSCTMVVLALTMKRLALMRELLEEERRLVTRLVDELVERGKR